MDSTLTKPTTHPKQPHLGVTSGKQGCRRSTSDQHQRAPAPESPPAAWLLLRSTSDRTNGTRAALFDAFGQTSCKVVHSLRRKLLYKVDKGKGPRIMRLKLRTVCQKISSHTDPSISYGINTNTNNNTNNSGTTSSSSRASVASLRNSLPENPNIYDFFEIRKATNNFLIRHLHYPPPPSSSSCFSSPPTAALHSAHIRCIIFFIRHPPSSSSSAIRLTSACRPCTHPLHHLLYPPSSFRFHHLLYRLSTPSHQVIERYDLVACRNRKSILARITGCKRAGIDVTASIPTRQPGRDLSLEIHPEENFATHALPCGDPYVHAGDDVSSDVIVTAWLVGQGRGSRDDPWRFGAVTSWSTHLGPSP
ncbi:hypothetical protein Sjap_020180 [Stephania japonica]|uniref:Uncharacterized protein n=1 Tax=Stephania japonica TaxID=461633 RepID=A0AAP0F1L2_9MAGN